MKWIAKCIQTFFRASLGGVIILTPIFIVIYMVGGGGEPVSDSVEEGGDSLKTMYELQPGECFNVDTLVLPTVTSIACSAPHDMEVFAIIDMENMQLSPVDDLRAICVPLFENFAGIELDRSILQVSAWNPSDFDFMSGFRTTPCFFVPFRRN